eukprot:15356298-Ditylum_brightwellii.AAC.1
MCVARNIATAKKKFSARGKQCIWVGYAVGHAVGTHRLIDPRTKRVILSRDVHFLGKSYGQWAKVTDPVKVPLTPVVDNSDDEYIDMPKLIRRVSSSDNDDEADNESLDAEDEVPGLIEGSESENENDDDSSDDESTPDIIPYYDEDDDMVDIDTNAD